LTTDQRRVAAKSVAALPPAHRGIQGQKVRTCSVHVQAIIDVGPAFVSCWRRAAAFLSEDRPSVHRAQRAKQQ
jgi:hypothetical protein